MNYRTLSINCDRPRTRQGFQDEGHQPDCRSFTVITYGVWRVARKKGEVVVFTEGLESVRELVSARCC